MAQTQTIPAQHQEHQPGRQSELNPQPISDSGRPGSARLDQATVLITGGDSGIGRAVAIAAAKEGANVAIACLEEHDDAKETRRLVEEYGRACLLLAGDLGDERVAKSFVEKVVERYGSLDVVVNGAGEQHPTEKPEDITEEQLERTFRTNVFAQFFAVKAALPHLREGA